MAEKKEELSFVALKNDILNGKFAPIYVLSGEEAYYIDQLQELIIKHALSDDERDFNLYVHYGIEADIPSLISDCRRFPMMSERQVVVLREAQNVDKPDLEKLAFYAEEPSPSTVLVVCYKVKRGETGRADFKATEFLKTLKAKKTGIYFQSKPLYESSVAPMIRQFCADNGASIDPKAVMMLTEHVGADLSKLVGAVEKLCFIAGKQTITAEMVERNIGVSKEYNIFELEDAISSRNLLKMHKILDYYSQNTKAAAVPMIVSMLFNYFSTLLLIRTARDPSRDAIKKRCGVFNDFRFKKFADAANSFSTAACVNAIALIRELDTMSKGQNSRQNPYDLLKDTLFKILHTK